MLKKNNIRELIDLSLGDDFDSRQINLVLLSASLCIQQSSIRRPSMRQACSLITSSKITTQILIDMYIYIHTHTDNEINGLTRIGFWGSGCAAFEWKP